MPISTPDWPAGYSTSDGYSDKAYPQERTSFCDPSLGISTSLLISRQRGLQTDAGIPDEQLGLSPIFRNGSCVHSCKDPVCLQFALYGHYAGRLSGITIIHSSISIIMPDSGLHKDASFPDYRLQLCILSKGSVREAADVEISGSGVDGCRTAVTGRGDALVRSCALMGHLAIQLCARHAFSHGPAPRCDRSDGPQTQFGLPVLAADGMLAIAHLPIWFIV